MSKNGRIMLSGALVLIALALYIIGIIILARDHRTPDSDGWIHGKQRQ